MPVSEAWLVERCRKLGLACDAVPTERLSSVLAALACFPMYMVANEHHWTTDRKWHIPFLDLPGFEKIREGFVIGEEEAAFDLSKEHKRVLGSLLASGKPSDLVVYEYALETLREFLTLATPPLAERVRTAVAHMIVAVAQAAGKGLFGTGTKISPEEKSCIGQISRELSLQASPAAAAILGKAFAPT
jgi:hypothetical protein